MRDILQYIFEASGKPSDLKKYKSGNVKKKIHLISGDIYDFSDPGYDDELDYFNGEGNGYIKDKSGKVYDVIASESTDDAGRIAGGSHSWKVIIKRANGKDDFIVTGYSAIFSSNYNTECISDITNGYYLEDYIAKYYNPSNDPEGKFKELASKGNKSAKSYNQEKSDKKSDKIAKFYERYVVMPERIYWEISNNEFNIINWRLDSAEAAKLKQEKNKYNLKYEDSKKYEEINNKIKDANERFNNLILGILNPILSMRIKKVFKTSDIKKLNGIGGTFSYEGTYKLNGGFDRTKNAGYKVVGLDTKEKKFVVIDQGLNKVIDSNLKIELNDSIKFKKSKASKEMINLFKKVAEAWKKTEGRKKTEYVANNWEEIWQSGRGMYSWNSDKYTKGQAKEMAKEKFIRMVQSKDFKSNDVLEFSLQLIQGYIEGDLNPEESPVKEPLKNPEPKKERGKNTKMSSKAKNDAYEKMKAWHEGTRKQNLANCSDAKLKMNYQVCKELNYTNEIQQIEKEAQRRGLMLESFTMEDYVELF